MQATRRPQSPSFFQKAPQASFSVEKKYLQKVYSTLCVALATAAVASYLDIAFHVHGILTTIGAFVGVMLVAVSPQQKMKLLWLTFTAFCMGSNLGPLISMSMANSSSLVFTALACTTVLFACLSGAAIVAPSKQYLFLGGILSSAISMLCLVGLMNMFFRSPAIHSASLYLGLLIYAGYVLYDTQVILNKAKQGYDNVVGDALHLFLDFLGLFIRILIILNSNNKKKNNR